MSDVSASLEESNEVQGACRFWIADRLRGISLLFARTSRGRWDGGSQVDGGGIDLGDDVGLFSDPARRGCDAIPLGDPNGPGERCLRRPGATTRGRRGRETTMGHQQQRDEIFSWVRGGGGDIDSDVAFHVLSFRCAEDEDAIRCGISGIIGAAGFKTDHGKGRTSPLTGRILRQCHGLF